MQTVSLVPEEMDIQENDNFFNLDIRIQDEQKKGPMNSSTWWDTCGSSCHCDSVEYACSGGYSCGC